MVQLPLIFIVAVNSAMLPKIDSLSKTAACYKKEFDFNMCCSYLIWLYLNRGEIPDPDKPEIPNTKYQIPKKSQFRLYASSKTTLERSGPFGAVVTNAIKFEARNSKSETNSKFEFPNVRNSRAAMMHYSLCLVLVI